ncbi:MAG: DUF378 domain-containing protein [bacterium]|nr:DUF378 domain-containing protein [bacterium]
MNCAKSCGVHKLVMGLVFVGALSWGLIGLFDWNLVNAIFGGAPVVERIVYILVGLAGLMMLSCGNCKMCKSGK